MEVVVATPVEVASPWGRKQPAADTSSLADIMSEQLALEIHQRQERSAAKFSTVQAVKPPLAEPLAPDDIWEDGDCGSDEAIARTLQAQFDREHDANLTRCENKLNGTAKVGVSFARHRAVPPGFDVDSEEEEELESEAGLESANRQPHWDELSVGEGDSMPRCGYRRDGVGGLVTKHDAGISGRRNARRVMHFPPEFATGDGAGFDMRLSNQVFNGLRAHSRHESNRRSRLHDRADLSTAEMGIDQRTRLILFKLVNQGLLERVNGVVSTGKEAVVLHADGGCRDDAEGGDGDDDEATQRKHDGSPPPAVPRECAVKVFKTTLAGFKSREQYIVGDFRFKDRYARQNPQKIVRLWAEKEMHNLHRMRNAGLRVPQPIALRKHVLVMSFVGADNCAAPTLHHATLTTSQLRSAFKQCAEFMRTLYHKAQLVHADLSEYNVLWLPGECWFIDASAAVERQHPMAHDFLRRDAANVAAFFRRRRLDGAPDGEALMAFVLGSQEASAESLLCDPEPQDTD